MPMNESFKIPFFKLLVFSSVIDFLNSTFIFYKGISESLAKSKLTFPDYKLSNMFFINTYFYYLEILKLIQAQKYHLRLNFVI